MGSVPPTLPQRPRWIVLGAGNTFMLVENGVLVEVLQKTGCENPDPEIFRWAASSQAIRIRDRVARAGAARRAAPERLRRTRRETRGRLPGRTTRFLTRWFPTTVSSST